MLGDKLYWLHRRPQNVLWINDGICSGGRLSGSKSGAILRCDGTVSDNTKFVALCFSKVLSTSSN